MSLVDAVVISPMGQMKVVDRGIPALRGQKLMIAGHVQMLWPVGLERTLTHLSRLVLLDGKRPIARDWPTAVLRDKDVVSHVLRGGNVGLRAGNGLVILDFDDEAAEAEMIAALGTITATVKTGSGKRHYYIKAADELPAKIRWNGQIVGEIQRTNSQQVVCPPSLHPDSRAPYLWVAEPGPLQPLPEAWIKHLMSQDSRLVSADPEELPSYIKVGDARGHEADGNDWSGPSADEILERASRQPGARRRAGGFKFQCPGCAAVGRDRHRDNAIVRNDGRWGCAVDERHKHAIGIALGVVQERELQTADLVDEEDLIETDLPLQTEEPELELL